MLNSLRILGLSAIFAAIAFSGSARAEAADFGPWYVIVGGSLHMAEVSSFDDSFGFNVRAGVRENDWFGYELHYEYIAKTDGLLFGVRRTYDEVSIHSVMPQLRFRYKFGFIEPYAIFGGGLLIGDVTTATNPKRTDVGLGMRTGGGLLTSFDFPVNVFVEYSRLFAAGRTTLFDYSSIGFGLEGRF